MFISVYLLRDKHMVLAKIVREQMRAEKHTFPHTDSMFFRPAIRIRLQLEKTNKLLFVFVNSIKFGKLSPDFG